MTKKLLIFCYFFPPYPSIGGRRAAKFAKYLAKKGDEIHVIHARNPFPTTSPWLKDVENAKSIIQYEFPLRYPLEFIVPPTNLVGKMKYRLWKFIFTVFYSTKNPYDYTFFWKGRFLKKAKEIIEKNKIENVLVSGPPFYYARQAVELKKYFPKLNILLDFRDPWIDSPYYGMSILKKQQYDYEINLINEVYQKCNYFLAPNTFLLERQMKFILEKNNHTKVVELPHAYDEDETLTFQDTEPTLLVENKIKLVYGGQLYPGTDEILKGMSVVLQHLKDGNPELYSQLQIEFYTPETDREVHFINHKEIVSFHKPVGNGIMKKIKESSFCMIFLADHNKDFRTTKFLEYAILRRPFLIFGNKGYVAEFVEGNNLGVAFDGSSLDAFESFLKHANTFIINEFNTKFDFSKFSFANVTEDLRSLLN